MINLRKFQEELGRLERSLALEAIWPGVFDAGKVTTHWVATPVGRNYRGIVHAALSLTVVSGDGEIRTFTRDEVPECIPSPPRKEG